MTLLAGLAAFLLAQGAIHAQADLGAGEILAINGFLATMWATAAWQDKGSGIPAGIFQLLAVPLFLLYLVVHWQGLYVAAVDTAQPAAVQNLVKVIIGLAFIILPLFLMIARPAYNLLRDTGMAGGKENA